MRYWVLTTATVLAAVVAAFAIYTWGWRNPDRNARKDLRAELDRRDQALRQEFLSRIRGFRLRLNSIANASAATRQTVGVFCTYYSSWDSVQLYGDPDVDDLANLVNAFAEDAC